MIGAVDEVGGFGKLLCDREQVGIVADPFDHRHCGAALVGGLQTGVERHGVHFREP
jgi:hypothetical protein